MICASCQSRTNGRRRCQRCDVVICATCGDCTHGLCDECVELNNAAQDREDAAFFASQEAEDSMDG